MKKTTVVLILFCACIKLISQNYHPLITQNKSWDLAESDARDICYDPDISRTVVGEDTLINGKYYSKLYYSTFISLGTPPCGEPFEIDTNFVLGSTFIREDTSNRKVYAIESGEASEYLLYDFTLQKGDTFSIGDYNLLLNTIDSIQLHNGDYRKRYMFYNSFDEPFFIVEGIGSLNGLLNTDYVVGLGFSIDIICVKENETPIWGYSCNYGYVNTEILNLESPKLFPNPFTDLISIQGLSDVETVKVFSASGKLLKTIKERSLQKIDLSEFQNGVYIVELTDFNNRVLLKQKIIKI